MDLRSLPTDLLERELISAVEFIVSYRDDDNELWEAINAIVLASDNLNTRRIEKNASTLWRRD